MPESTGRFADDEFLLLKTYYGDAVDTFEFKRLMKCDPEWSVIGLQYQDEYVEVLIKPQW